MEVVFLAAYALIIFFVAIRRLRQKVA